MDVGHQLPQIPLLLTQNGFVAVLEKMPVAAMPLVEAHGIAGQKPAHERSDRNASGPQQQEGQ